MKTLRRLTSGLFARFDAVVCELEDHESQVTAALKQVQEAEARARVQLRRVTQDGIELRRRFTELQTTAKLWEDRAKQVANLDKTRAFECLRRRNKVAADFTEAERQVAVHEHYEQQLNKDIVALTSRIDKLKVQLNLLRTRQSRAEAAGILNGQGGALVGEIDELLERWEVRVSTQEELSIPTKQLDNFEAEFTDAEETSALEQELARLMEVQS